MKDKDDEIFANFFPEELESTDPNIERVDLGNDTFCEISADGTRANIITRKKNAYTLKGESREIGIRIALEKLEKTRSAWCDFMQLMIDSDTGFFLSDMATAFGDYSFFMTEFIENLDNVTPEIFDDSKLSSYLSFEAAKVLVEQLFIDCYETYVEDQNEANNIS